MQLRVPLSFICQQLVRRDNRHTICRKQKKSVAAPRERGMSEAPIYTDMIDAEWAKSCSDIFHAELYSSYIMLDSLHLEN